MPTDPVITRFAPSPTGHLHVGGARTALFCWAYARKHAGTFILRIEDTDQARSSESATRGILEDLAWLGIDWDEGPVFQAITEGGASCPPAHAGAEVGSSISNAGGLEAPPSERHLGGDPRHVGPFYQAERLTIYNEHIERLIEQDKAYPAFDTPQELEARRAAAAARKETFRYVRAPDYDRAASFARARTEPHVVRFRMPAEPIVVHDQVLGEIRFEPEHVDDFVIRKVDGFPTYHLAVVVDDELMGVTHVLRGQEHLNNTPRHVALQKAFAFRTPVYAHLPLIFNPDKSKMSKRDKDRAARAHFLAELERDRDRVLRIAASVVDCERFEAWLGDKKSQLETKDLVELQRLFTLGLPEVDVDDFRRAGYLPEVLDNFLALLGWNPGMKTEDGKDLERFDTAFLAKEFDLARLGKSPSSFDRAKLLAFNADTIQAMTDDQFASRWRTWAERDDPELLETLNGERFAWAASAARPRCKTFRDARDVLAYAFTDDEAIAYDEKAVAKNLTKAGEGEATGLELLAQVAGVLAALDEFEPGAIDAAIEDFATSKGVKIGRVAQPIRVAITGAAVSPPLGLTLAILGKARTLARLERCVAVAK
ncbi:MAG: glutamate--tRNA ligase [Phycisphaerales bacterium]